jgi:hypothetical protein
MFYSEKEEEQRGRRQKRRFSFFPFQVENPVVSFAKPVLAFGFQNPQAPMGHEQQDFGTRNFPPEILPLPLFPSSAFYG